MGMPDVARVSIVILYIYISWVCTYLTFLLILYYVYNGLAYIIIRGGKKNGKVNIYIHQLCT
jgi:hypothetical protein